MLELWDGELDDPEFGGGGLDEPDPPLPDGGGGGDGGPAGGAGGGGGVTFGTVTGGGGGGGGGGTGGGLIETVVVATGVDTVTVGSVGRLIALSPGPVATAASTPAAASARHATDHFSLLPDRTFLQLLLGRSGCGLRVAVVEDKLSWMPGAAGEATRDYYDVLGVERDAEAETIKKAFRTRARALHPDVSDDPGAAEKFRELSEAYAVLSKHSTRLLYDRFGYRGRGNGWFTPDGARTASDFLRGRTPAVGEVLVDEYEAERGVRRRVRWRRSEPCDACEGDGAAPGAISMACPACEGSGRRRMEGVLADGERLLQIDDCPTCGGGGRLVSDPCPACDGSGVTTYEESGEVHVPPGAADGDRVPVVNGRTRDVVVRVLAAPPEHAFFRYAAALGLLVALVFLWILLR